MPEYTKNRKFCIPGRPKLGQETWMLKYRTSRENRDVGNPSLQYKNSKCKHHLSAECS